jgi:hypothetical protein
MATEPDQIRAQVETMLADSSTKTESGLDETMRRLEEVHEFLEHALQSVQKG